MQVKASEIQKRDMQMPREMIVRAALAILVAAVAGGTAWAHPVLEGSDPKQDTTVSAPKEIRLTFTENLIARFSGLTIKDQSGHAIATASPTVDPTDKRQLVVPMWSPLPPGTYDVEWHAVATDTHRVTGRFSFQVAQ
jgi:copper resistance protein C